MRRDPTRSETLKRVHRDRLRRLRVLEYLDNSAVFADSPVEIKESYAVSDRDTGEESEEIPGEIAMETNIAGMDESILC